MKQKKSAISGSSESSTAPDNKKSGKCGARNAAIGIAVVSVLLIGGSVTAIYAADEMSEKADKHREHMETIRNAIENNDYDSWESEMNSIITSLQELVTPETFSTMQQAHEYMESGDHEQAHELIQDLDMPFLMHGKAGKGMKGKFMGQHEEMEDALESGDYQAWEALMNERPNTDVEINQETFEKMQQAHEYREQGDKDSARKIMEELGLHKFKRGGR